jgi:hypothetical protein
VAVDPLERAIADACLGPRGDELSSDLRGFLEAHGVAPDDVEAIVDSPHGLPIYRSLVRNGLARVVGRMLARTRSRMNAACGGRFDADLARFLDAVGPRTHYLRDVPHELVGWAEPSWRADASVPGYLPDLAAHELTAFAVAAAEEGEEGALDEIALDKSVALSGTARLLHHAWAVHELESSESATDEPARRDVHLLAYRDAEHAVRWLELTPLAASIVERSLARQTLGAAIADACVAHDTAPAAVTSDVAKLLADLAERGVLRGGHDSGAGGLIPRGGPSG